VWNRRVATGGAGALIWRSFQENSERPEKAGLWFASMAQMYESRVLRPNGFFADHETCDGL